MEMGHNEIVDKLDLWNFEKWFVLFFRAQWMITSCESLPALQKNAENWTKTSVSSNMLSRNAQNISWRLIYIRAKKYKGLQKNNFEFFVYLFRTEWPADVAPGPLSYFRRWR